VLSSAKATAGAETAAATAKANSFLFMPISISTNLIEVFPAAILFLGQRPHIYAELLKEVCDDHAKKPWY
jgi:hypothetical protein